MTRQDRQFHPRKQPVQSRSAETVDVILEATVRILERAGDGRFTTKEVAEVAGVSVGSLYQYFPNKQALASELVRRKMARLVGVAEGAATTAPPGVAAAAGHMIGEIIAEKRQNDRYWRALQAITATVDVQPLVRDHTLAIFRVTRAMIEARVGRALDDAELGRLVIAMDALEGALSQMVKTAPARLNESGVSATFTRLFLAALDLPDAARALG